MSLVNEILKFKTYYTQKLPVLLKNGETFEVRKFLTFLAKLISDLIATDETRLSATELPCSLTNPIGTQIWRECYTRVDTEVMSLWPSCAYTS